MEDSDIKAVGLTSLMVAAGRARESERQHPLFADPYGSIFAGKLGNEMFDKIVAAKPELLYSVRARTAYIDELVRKYVLDGTIKQVVILGVGMDARALRMPFSEEVTVFELDFNDVLNYKDRMIKASNIIPTSKAKRTCIAIDLRDDLDWSKLIVENGFKVTERTFWILEGLLMYLSESDVITTLKRIYSLSASDSFLVAQILREVAAQEKETKVTKMLHNINVELTWVSQNAEKLFKEIGFKDVKRIDNPEVMKKYKCPEFGEDNAYWIEAKK
jgi:methyltransferase (TIGR00027 family)